MYQCYGFLLPISILKMVEIKYEFLFCNVPIWNIYVCIRYEIYMTLLFAYTENHLETFIIFALHMMYVHLYLYISMILVI
jgi:hypothetical protein